MEPAGFEPATSCLQSTPPPWRVVSEASVFLGDHAPRGVTARACGSRRITRNRHGCGHRLTRVPDPDRPRRTFGCARGPALRPAAAVADESSVDLERAYRLHAQRLVAELARTLPREDAEDVAATAWAIAVRRGVTDNARAYVWTVETRLAWWTASRRRDASRDVVALSADPRDRLAAREDWTDVLAACRELPARQRRLLGLSAAGLPREQFAGATGDSSKTVDRQLGRARRRLRSHL